MNNFSGISPDTERNVGTLYSEDARNDFKSRTLSSDRKFKLPRRYVIALLLCLLSVLQILRDWSVSHAVFWAVHSMEKQTEHPSIQNWTEKEYEIFFLAIDGADIFVNMLAGLLIYWFSGHKFLLVSVTVSSILHILTSTAVGHQSFAFLLIVVVGQEISSISVFTAILSVCRDWAPPDERSVFLTISFFGFAMRAIGFLIALVKLPVVPSHYLGVAGIIWVLFWYNITSSTPQCDPMITEKEYFYLESKIPANYQEKISLKDVPWWSMVKCKQVIFLFLLFFKFACSMHCFQWYGMRIILSDSIGYNGYIFVRIALLIPFFVAFTSVLFVSSILMDILLKKYRDKALIIRKTFMCSGFIMQSVLLVPAITANGRFFGVVSCMIAYIFFALSIPGLLRIPLDLAPRYVSIVAGFGFAFYSLGLVCFQLLVIHTPYLFTYDMQSYYLIFDIVVSLFTGVIFLIWGEVEERTWSVLTPSRRRGKDYRSQPEPENEGDIILTPSE